MAASFFFYDLETSGINSRESRIMQFAGQRTDLNLKPIGEPENLFIKMTPDVLPDPDAIMITGITPQSTMVEGLAEAEFLRYFTDQIAIPGTIFLGYNTVRFDDEFMRMLHYRNFYDAYEWQWQDFKSRWDLLDVVRMTRALRPEGIEWPFNAEGKATNRLELITALNKLNHEHAHDALSDVYATIEVANLIRNKHTKLFDYLLTMRDKRKVADLADACQPFVYSSGQYPGEYEKTAVVVKICDHPKRQGSLVYDLRHDPAKYKDMTAVQLAEAWKWKKDAAEERLPVKVLQYNKCPAVAPLGVLTEGNAMERLKIDMAMVKKNLAILKKMPDLEEKLCQAVDILDEGLQTTLLAGSRNVDDQLYDGFFGNQDKQAMRVVRAAQPDELSDLNLAFQDKRLTELLPLYKARNFPKTLSTDERTAWDEFCKKQLLDGGQHSRVARYLNRLQEIAAREDLTGHQQYILEELKLYAESIMPEPEY